MRNDEQKAWALTILGPIILARPGGCHSLVLAKLGIPKNEWARVREIHEELAIARRLG